MRGSNAVFGDIASDAKWSEVTWIRGQSTRKERGMLRILQLSNGKWVYITGKEITRDDAHEIIIQLTDTWGTDFERQDLKDKALGLRR